jgi:hypothetical protein
MQRMYLGSEFHQFWSRCESRQIHPDDEPFFKFDGKKDAEHRLAGEYKTDDYGPWPFDGPIDTAKVVVCYANPLYLKADNIYADLIFRQRSGVEPLPEPSKSQSRYKTSSGNPLLQGHTIKGMV